MHWTKTRTVINTWTAFEFSISDSSGVEEKPFRLDQPDPDTQPEFFATLKDAQRAAEVLNRLRLVEEDNARLRQELEDRKAADAFQRQAEAAMNLNVVEPDAGDWDEPEDVPTDEPEVDAIAGQLLGAFARNGSHA